MGMWSGRETQQFEKWEPTSESLPRFLVPPGTKCAVRNVTTDQWSPYQTTKPNGFERFEVYERTEEGNFYHFRLGTWILAVHRRHVVHREDIDKLEQRLRQVAGR
jgi:hypothetical protein